MGDITNPKVLYLKSFLFLVTGGLASLGLLLEHPTLKVAFLLGVAVWSFARFYYFTFYVIEHYIDSTYRFAGLGAFALHLLRSRGRKPVNAEARNASSTISSVDTVLPTSERPRIEELADEIPKY